MTFVYINGKTDLGAVVFNTGSGSVVANVVTNVVSPGTSTANRPTETHAVLQSLIRFPLEYRLEMFLTRHYLNSDRVVSGFLAALSAVRDWNCEESLRELLAKVEEFGGGSSCCALADDLRKKLQLPNTGLWCSGYPYASLKDRRYTAWRLLNNDAQAVDYIHRCFGGIPGTDHYGSTLAKILDLPADNTSFVDYLIQAKKHFLPLNIAIDGALHQLQARYPA